MRIAKDKSEQKCIDDIRDYGLHIINVFEDGQGPGFAYSVGLYETYAHPEIIITGLRMELAHNLLNNMADDIKIGKTFKAGQFHDDVLDNFLCYFGRVPKSQYKEHVGWDIWYYDGYDFPLLQCVYPTVKGVFPWEKDFPEDARWFCPMLTGAPLEHKLT